MNQPISGLAWDDPSLKQRKWGATGTGLAQWVKGTGGGLGTSTGNHIQVYDEATAPLSSASELDKQLFQTSRQTHDAMFPGWTQPSLDQSPASIQPPTPIMNAYGANTENVQESESVNPVINSTNSPLESNNLVQSLPINSNPWEVDRSSQEFSGQVAPPINIGQNGFMQNYQSMLNRNKQNGMG